MKFLSFIPLIALLLIGACKGPKNPTAANDPLAVNTPATFTHKVDLTKSVVSWVGSKPGGQHNGTIGLKSGELLFENETLKSGSFVIDMNQINCLDITDTASASMLVNHLKNADFFDVTKFPEGKFTIISAEPISGDVSATHSIAGNLELKGITKSITFKAKIEKQGQMYMASTQDFTINRTDWGVNYQSKNVFKELKDKFIDDNIQIKLVIAATSM